LAVGAALAPIVAGGVAVDAAPGTALAEESSAFTFHAKVHPLSNITAYAFASKDTKTIKGGADCGACGYVAFDTHFVGTYWNNNPTPTISPSGSATLLYTGKDTPQDIELTTNMTFSSPSTDTLSLDGPSFSFSGQTASWDSGKIAKAKSTSVNYSSQTFRVSASTWFSGFDQKATGGIWFDNQETLFACSDDLGYSAVWYGN
jgi:hypothetical protein